MLSFLNDPSEQIQSEIEGIRRENRELLEANLEYCRFLGEEKEMEREKK